MHKAFLVVFLQQDRTDYMVMTTKNPTTIGGTMFLKILEGEGETIEKAIEKLQENALLMGPGYHWMIEKAFGRKVVTTENAATTQVH